MIQDPQTPTARDAQSVTAHPFRGKPAPQRRGCRRTGSPLPARQAGRQREQPQKSPQPL